MVHFGKIPQSNTVLTCLRRLSQSYIYRLYQKPNVCLKSVLMRLVLVLPDRILRELFQYSKSRESMS
jgi:hypothetical protein